MLKGCCGALGTADEWDWSAWSFAPEVAHQQSIYDQSVRDAQAAADAAASGSWGGTDETLFNYPMNTNVGVSPQEAPRAATPWYEVLGSSFLNQAPAILEKVPDIYKAIETGGGAKNVISAVLGPSQRDLIALQTAQAQAKAAQAQQNAAMLAAQGSGVSNTTLLIGALVVGGLLLVASR